MAQRVKILPAMQKTQVLSLYGCCLDVNGRVWLYEESAKGRGISDEDAMLVYVQG